MFTFIEVLRDVPAFMRTRAEEEWTDWFDALTQRRVAGTERRRNSRQAKKELGTPKTPAQIDRKARGRRMRRLRVKQIFARLNEVGELGLNQAETEELAWARGRVAARKKIDERRQQREL